ncbi:MAG: bifunctional demethylmenaquinone methyltransferase/2-methoxy-6-polyprenyl-1,4-benzoquinol methylase UbiE [Tannerellaceae bacterium]|jgi:demethylmenaquinone methyltransferase/2-methoxy-6-polyprenyl-1,4-benzoquinol methylase|nr:bifunctional demethylmenaquinone methyltransferase/2-methoxy-6-polyprenyl-1,4-benzoquinol methylase UbiE [Tannerellaceae bacterium]
MAEAEIKKPASPESVLPYDSPERKSLQALRMFNDIAGTYDRLNHVLSFGFDKGWRRKAVEAIDNSPALILDLAAGTGDLALLMARRLQPCQIVAGDISEKMMEIGKMKAERAGLSNLISFEYQDCLCLSFENDTFEAVAIAFGLRNLEDIRKGVAEMHRVLKPGGRLLVLELSSPQSFPMKQLYYVYSRTIIPLAGLLLSGRRRAYSYLPASIRAVPQGREMQQLLADAGFDKVSSQTFTGGICSLYTGTKTNS